MPMYKLTVAYDGTRFNGFQRQHSVTSSSESPQTARPSKRPHWDSVTGQRQQCGTLTIQECLEHAIVHWDTASTVESLCMRFAGRTDKGVHAKGQVVVIWMETVIPEETLYEMRKALNSRLPVDISIERVDRVPDDFCPRKDVVQKRYSYHIKFRRLVKDKKGHVLDVCHAGPQTIRSASDPPNLWVCPWALDDSKLRELCDRLEGTHDFRAFVHKDERDKRDHTMTIRMEYETIQEIDEPELAPVITVRFVLESKGFRRAMIRNLVGFCVDVCRGADHTAGIDWKKFWNEGEEIAKKVHSAPASGLSLDSVEYVEPHFHQAYTEPPCKTMLCTPWGA
jgi:tRNA pseudouridine38-40 synthase